MKNRKKNIGVVLKEFTNFCSFSFDEKNVLFSSKLGLPSKFINVIQLTDFTNLLSVNQSSKTYIIDELNKLLENYDYSFIKSKKIIEPQIDEYQKIIKSLDDDLNIKKENWIFRTNKKIILLDSLKEQLNNQIWENNFYLLIFSSERDELQKITSLVCNKLSSFNFLFSLLEPNVAFDVVKKIHNNDEIDSKVLQLDSRIPKENLLNIKEIKQFDDYMLINNNQYLSIVQIDYRFVNDKLLEKIYCFNDIDFVINYRSSNLFVNIICRSNELSAMMEQKNNVIDLINKFGDLDYDNNEHEQIKIFINLFDIQSKLNQNNFNCSKKLLHSNPFRAYSLLGKSDKINIGFNCLNQPISISSENSAILNVGKYDGLAKKWLIHNLIANNKILVFDYYHEFDRYLNVQNNYEKQLTVNIFALDINEKNIDDYERIKSSKIRFLIDCFSLLNQQDFSLPNQCLISDFLNAFYDKQFAKVKKKQTKFSKITIFDIVKELQSSNQKNNKVRHIIANLIDVLIDNKSVLDFISHSSFIGDEDQQILFFNFSWINDQFDDNIKNFLHYVINEHLLSYMKKTSECTNLSLYINNIDTFLDNQYLNEQFINMVKCKKVNRYFELNDISKIQQPLIDRCDYINIYPQDQPDETIWLEALKNIKSFWSNEDYKRLNTIDKSWLLILNKKNKYWYKMNVFDWEENIKYEFDKHALIMRVNDLEKEIHYKIIDKKAKRKDFILHNVFNKEVQEKIWKDNWNHSKKLRINE